MKKLMILAVAVLVTIFVSPGYADVIALSPSQVAVTEDGNGNAQVAVQFDLGGLRSGEGRRIESAILDWSLTGVSAEEEAGFAAHPVTAAWDGGEIEQELAELSVGEVEAGSWVITPAEHESGLGGVVRMNITGTVAGWASDPSSNHGIVITTSALATGELAEQVSGLRLIVAYGFVVE